MLVKHLEYTNQVTDVYHDVSTLLTATDADHDGSRMLTTGCH